MNLRRSLVCLPAFLALLSLPGNASANSSFVSRLCSAQSAGFDVTAVSYDGSYERPDFEGLLRRAVLEEPRCEWRNGMLPPQEPGSPPGTGVVFRLGANFRKLSPSSDRMVIAMILAIELREPDKTDFFEFSVSNPITVLSSAEMSDRSVHKALKQLIDQLLSQ